MASLVGDGVDVAEAPLEGRLREDRARAGGMIRRVHDLLGLVDGMGRGQPDGHAMVEREAAHALDLVPDVRERRQEEQARRAQLDLRLRDLRLDDRVVAHLMARAPRRLVARQPHEGVERGTGDAEGDAGEA